MLGGNPVNARLNVVGCHLFKGELHKIRINAALGNHLFKGKRLRGMASGERIRSDAVSEPDTETVRQLTHHTFGQILRNLCVAADIDDTASFLSAYGGFLSGCIDSKVTRG